MPLASSVLNLPQKIGQAVYTFLFAPGQSVHAERLALPEGLSKADASARAVALARDGEIPQSLDTAWHSQIDWRSLEHRTAVLPREALEVLAWYLGLAAYASALRQVVLREELLSLQSGGVAAEHLEFVYALPASETTQPIVKPSVSRLTPEHASSDIWRAGWACLSSFAGQLPAALGARLMLKLPLQDAGDESPKLSFETFRHVRQLVVSSVVPEFDASLESLAAV